MTDIVAAKLNQLPQSPGVYIMKDERGQIIYVGKAVVLKNRVRQYFHGNKQHSPKVRAMVAKIADFETIMTNSEVEALILECNLIKKHRPRYNISLKDDKTYPYVKVTLAEEFPRVVITRRLLKDGAKYFGPYTDVGAVHESLKLLRRLFPLRTCKKMDMGRPCLEYHIKRCPAPCVDGIAKEEYGEIVNSVVLFLEGRTEEVERDLTRRMERAAAALDFEQAAALRDQLKAVRRVAEKQTIDAGDGDRDVAALARSAAGACAVLFFVRGGKLVGRERFFLRGSDDETDAAVLTAFLEQYYHRATFIPKEILLPQEMTMTDGDTVAAWLTERRGAKVQLEYPRRGVKRDLVEMAAANAAKYLHDEAERLARDEAMTTGALAELGRYLGLAEPPRRMECFDISHIQGSETVASMVVFENGMPNKGAYRRYKLKTTEGVNDDFQSMREVCMRRYGTATVPDMPDLIIIDGGKGQLSSALAIIRGAGHKTVQVVGLAKQFEYVFLPGRDEPVILPRRSQALYLIQRIRDEAHRFAITYHRQLRGKRNLVSVLDHVAGIGPKRRKLLWDHFGTLAKIRAATLAELCAVKGMTKTSAKAVFDFFAAHEGRRVD